MTSRQGRELRSEVLCEQLAPYGAVVDSPGRQACVCRRPFGQPRRGGRIVRYERSYGALESVGDPIPGLALAGLALGYVRSALPGLRIETASLAGLWKKLRRRETTGALTIWPVGSEG